MNVIAGKYNIKIRIGTGSFGDIFMGKVTDTNEDIAIKLEKISCKHPHLEQECKVLRLLNSSAKRKTGVPKLIWFGTEGDYKAMVMELLGPNLEEIFTLCNRKFPMDTILQIISQIVSLLEFLHSSLYIHKDVKPENILIGLGKSSSLLYLIDYGLTKKFISKSGIHKEHKDNQAFVGTDIFSSINSLKGCEQSRRDDLESALYIGIYFCLGSLPWSTKSTTNDYLKIAKMKEEFIKNRSSCIPQVFYDLLNYVKGLGYSEEPNYSLITNKLQVVDNIQPFVFTIGAYKEQEKDKAKM